MASLDNVSTEDLRQILVEVEGKKPTQRLMAAINYLEEDDATLEEVAQRYGYTAGWLSQWLDRLERLAAEPFEDVVYDEHRSGRPSELSEKEYEQFVETLHNSKSLDLTRPRGPLLSLVSTSKNSSTWSTANDTSGDCCPRPGCLGRQPGRSTTSPTNVHRMRGKRVQKKKRDSLDDEYTILAIDQSRQVLSTLIYAWFPEGTRPSLSVTGAWDSIKLLGAVSDIGETFFLPCAENFNSDTTIRLLDALQTEFGEKCCVVLDNASYFTANKVQEFVEETPIELCYLPRGSPELNPAEECWRQLDQALGNRLFETLDELRNAALSALDRMKCQVYLRTYVREYEEALDASEYSGQRLDGRSDDVVQGLLSG